MQIKAIIVLGMSMVLAEPVHAAPIAPEVQLSGRSATLVRNNVSGFNVVVAEYRGGKFEAWADGEWREYGNNGSAFTFYETARGETTVMLHDPSRDVYIEINVVDREIRYGEGRGGQFRLLYKITNLIATQQDTGAGNGDVVDVVQYTCDEGLPMTVEFRESGGRGVASFSIDTSPFEDLPQVRSASGAKYTNGQNTLITKGRSATLLTPSGQTNCRQD